MPSQKKKLTYKDIKLPPDWEWKDEWHIDKQLAVDDNGTVIIIYHSQQIQYYTGWEYCFGPGIGSWNPSERVNHHTRWRRWVRTRRRASKSRKPSIVEVQSANVYGFFMSYGLTFSHTHTHTHTHAYTQRKKILKAGSMFVFMIPYITVQIVWCFWLAENAQ